MKATRRVETAFWSAHSRMWDDALADADIAAHVDEVASWLADACPDGARVADLGCGTGNHSTALRARGMRVVGVDISPGMLDKAMAKADGRGDPRVLVRADLQATLPLATASVDAALSVYSTQFLDLATFMAEVRRIVRPGGAVLVEAPHAGAAPSRRGATFRLRIFSQVKRVAASAGEAAGVVHVRTPAGIRDAVIAGGFGVVDDRQYARSYAVLAR